MERAVLDRHHVQLTLRGPGDGPLISMSPHNPRKAYIERIAVNQWRIVAPIKADFDYRGIRRIPYVTVQHHLTFEECVEHFQFWLNMSPLGILP